MRRRASIVGASNVYPGTQIDVVGFRYCSHLHLTRSMKAVKTRRDEDAKYLIGTTYRATAKVRSAGSESRWHSICIPRGYKTDLASVPRLARFFVSRAGPHLEACIVHDWLYEAWIVTNEPPNRSMKKFADDVLKQALKEAKVRSYTVWAIYQACAKFGGREFRRKSAPTERPSKDRIIAPLDLADAPCLDEGCTT